MPTTVPPLRFRQVHLDFHTSPDIPGVATGFDADRFADTLKRAHVDSVTCFARCHHGHIYYPTRKHPERIHPTLGKRNLLGEQIAACHKRDIRVPIYITVQWDQFTADRHRDWLCVDEEGKEYGTPPLQAGFYRNLDVFHEGYRAFLFDHVKDVLSTFDTDGIFFDIVGVRPSLAAHWIAAMNKAGLDPANTEHRHQFGVRVIDEWQREMTAFVRKHNKKATIFYNAGHVGPRHRSCAEAFTHLELESLPSGGWGYLHFPLTQRYARGLPPFNTPRGGTMGMTGKFHTMWGDFHSYKNPAALQFECFHMLALGARCSVGDQLHPRGVLDEATYDLIGGVYASVEAKEPWCAGAVAETDIAVVTPEEFDGRRKHKTDHLRQHAAALGAVRMLQELRQQFDIVTTDRDLSAYKVVILPDDIPAEPAFARKLEAFVKRGGHVIASHRSGLTLDGDAFATPLLGVTLTGDAPFSPDFIVPSKALATDLPDTGHVMYMRGLEVKPAAKTSVLAKVEVPYFNRDFRHFCSHLHTPSAGKRAYPAIVEHATGKGRAVYFAHPLFSQYHDNAPRWCRSLLAAALQRLLPEPLVRADGPSTLIATLNHQPREKRRVLHLLHYIPERRGQKFDTIEDVLPLFDVTVSVKVPGYVESVRLVPEGKPLPFTTGDGRAEFTVPRLDGHAVIEIA